jgi:hypothetical protein
MSGVHPSFRSRVVAQNLECGEVSPVSSNYAHFNASLFEPDHLLDQQGLEIALDHIKNFISARTDQPHVVTHVILQCLVDQPYVFEFICSGKYSINS